MVSIICPVYNHELFLTDALDGFLSQVTEHPFQILIRDDASTDKSANIIADYVERYPNIIKPIYEGVNRYPHLRPRVVLGEVAEGKYIAYCDGDDYWLDQTKIQTQVSSLERRSDCVMSHHQSITVEDGRIASLHILPDTQARDWRAADLAHGRWLLTSTMLYRNVPIAVHPRLHNFTNYDAYFISKLGAHGGAVFESDLLPGVYRKHPSSVWSSLDKVDRNVAQVVSYSYISHHYREIGELALAKHWGERSLQKLRDVTGVSDTRASNLGAAFRKIRRKLGQTFTVLARFRKVVRRAPGKMGHPK
jgi:glycosyltransferase involved in cell wall biosynthesis